MDHTITVNGTRKLAEHACRMVFGEDAGAGPVRPAPKALLDLLDKWPGGASDQVVTLSLELPIDFDISREMTITNGRKAITLRANRITVLHEGKKVGFAIRTDKLGLNALAAWEQMWQAHLRRIRQAH